MKHVVNDLRYGTYLLLEDELGGEACFDEQEIIKLAGITAELSAKIVQRLATEERNEK